MSLKAFVVNASISGAIAKAKVNNGEELIAVFTSPEHATQYRIDAGLNDGWSVKDRNLDALLEELLRAGIDEVAVDAVFDAPAREPITVISLRAWARAQTPGGT